MTFSSEEVKPFSFHRLEKKEIPAEERVVSIWRKMRETEDEKAAEKAPEASPAGEGAARKDKASTPQSPPQKAPAAGTGAATVGGDAAEPEEAGPDRPPVPKINLRPRKPLRGSFLPMTNAEERPKGSFTGFITAPKPGPDGVRTIVLDSEREAEEAAEKTAAEKRAELMAEAQAEAAALKERAKAEGQQQGYAQGLAKAREEVRGELIPVLKKFAAETQGLLNYRAEILRAAEQEILELVLLIGKKVLHAELRLHPEVVAQVVRHALGRAIGWGRVSVLVNPEDCALLEEVKDSLAAGLESVTVAGFVPTPSIARGGCALQSNLGEVDVRLELQVGEVERALREALGERLEAGAEATPASQPPSSPQAAPAPRSAEPPRAEGGAPEAQPYRLRELGGQPPKESGP
jgi:flagellar biosynthesis/type III secretory pathway protein FliH